MATSDQPVRSEIITLSGGQWHLKVIANGDVQIRILRGNNLVITGVNEIDLGEISELSEPIQLEMNSSDEKGVSIYRVYWSQR
jgi:hypothetical protein